MPQSASRGYAFASYRIVSSWGRPLLVFRCPFAQYHHATFLRPLRRLRSRILRPVLVFMRYRKPCRLFCTRRVCPFIVLRGPKRICSAPASDGWDETAPVGTTSAMAAPVEVAGVGAGVKLVKPLGRRRGVREGRSGERVVNVLRRNRVSDDDATASAGRFRDSLRTWRRRVAC